MMMRKGMMAKTMSASCQLIENMKASEVRMLTAPQTASRRPQVINSATRSVSLVTREMIQPTGVWL